MAQNQELNTLKPFIYHAHEIEQVNPMFAFYLKTYVVEKGTAIYKKYQSENRQAEVEVLKTSLQQWIQEANKLKQNNPGAFSDKEANKKELINFILQLFLKCDNEERENNITRDTVRNFQVVSRYIEMLNVFGPLSQDLEEKRKYSKAKAVECNKKLKNPELYSKNQEKELENELVKLDAQIKQQEEQFGTLQPQNFENQNQQVRQSVFNQVPKVINRSTIQDQKSVSRILEHTGQSQIKPQLQQQQNYPMQSQMTPQPRNNGQQTPQPNQNNNYSQKKPDDQMYNQDNKERVKIQNFEVNNGNKEPAKLPQNQQNLAQNIPVLRQQNLILQLQSQGVLSEQQQKYQDFLKQKQQGGGTQNKANNYTTSTGKSVGALKTECQKLLDDSRSEIDFKNYSQARQKVEIVLGHLRELEATQK